MTLLIEREFRIRIYVKLLFFTMFTVNGKRWGRIDLGTLLCCPVEQGAGDVDALVLHTGDIWACGVYVNPPWTV